MNIKNRLLDGEILVLDDVLPLSLFSRIKNKIDDSMLWKYTEQTSLGAQSASLEDNLKNKITQLSYKDSKYDPNTISFHDTFSFGHNVFLMEHPSNPQPKELSPQFYESAELALAIGLEKLKLNIANLIRIRAGLITYKNTPSFHFPHIDMQFLHFNALLYLTTCNAPTRIFNEMYSFDYNKDVKYRSKTTDFLHKKFNGVVSTNREVESIANRMVIFHGGYYHSSSCPTDVDSRIALNYNFTL